MTSRLRLIAGLALVGAGKLFLLDAADYVQAWTLVGSWWPAGLIVLGLVALLSRPRSQVSGLILTVVGAVLLLSTLDIVNLAIWQLIIPLVLIAIGVGMITRGIGRASDSDSSSNVNVVAILGDQNVVSRAESFRKATLTAVLGEITLDLRRAAREERAGIDTFCMLGEVKILVPPDTVVELNGMPVLGEFVDKSTVTAASANEHSRLSLTGVALLGEVSVRNA